MYSNLLKVIVFTVVALTLERYLFAKKKHLANQFIKQSIGHMMLYILLIWVFALLFALFKTSRIELSYHEEVDAYACDSQLDHHSELVYTLLKCIVAFVLPYTIIIILSCCLLCFLKKWSAKSRTALNGGNNNRYSRQRKIKRKSTKFVLAVVFSFLCTWSPLWIYQCLIFLTEFESVAIVILSNVTLILVYLGGVINPLLYMLLTENFREFSKSLNKKFRDSAK
jgi:hypothetical protein